MLWDQIQILARILSQGHWHRKVLFICDDFLLSKISQPHCLVFRNNPETDWKFPFCFCWGDQVDADLQVSLQKYVIPAALNTFTHAIACLLGSITLPASLVQTQKTVTWSFPRKHTDPFNCTTTFSSWILLRFRSFCLPDVGSPSTSNVVAVWAPHVPSAKMDTNNIAGAFNGGADTANGGLVHPYKWALNSHEGYL